MPYYRHPADWTPERLAEVVDAYSALGPRPEIDTTCCAACEAVSRERQQQWDADAATHTALPPAPLAFSTIQSARAGITATEKVTFLATDAERSDWQYRERKRFASGEYVDVPWKGELEGETYGGNRGPRWPHLSIKTPGLIAYTKNDEHGFLDRQTAVKAGRYLKEFFTELTDEQIRDWSSKVQAINLDLHIATTADDIERVYLGGPSSCMSHGPEDYASFIHPVRVYGDSDLALAYYGDIDHASARAIVWPEKKLYGRLYGAVGTLRLLLEQNGYTEGSMSGACVQAIFDDDKGVYVLPFIDYIERAAIVTRDGKRWIELGKRGDLHTQRTDGLAGDPENEDDEDDDDYYTCDGCDDRIHANDAHNGGNGTYCGSCYDERFATCEYCNRTRSRYDMQTDTDGDYVCNACVRRESVSCAACAGRFMEALIDENRDADVIGHICADCSGDFYYCATCNTARRRDPDDSDCTAPVCETCHQTTAPAPDVPPSLPRDTRTFGYARGHNNRWSDGYGAYVMEVTPHGTFYVFDNGTRRECDWSLRDILVNVQRGAWVELTPTLATVPDTDNPF